MASPATKGSSVGPALNIVVANNNNQSVGTEPQFGALGLSCPNNTTTTTASTGDYIMDAPLALGSPGSVGTDCRASAATVCGSHNEISMRVHILGLENNMIATTDH